MADDPKQSEPGAFKKAFDAVGEFQWKAFEKINGKDAADLMAQSITAYSEGELKKGWKLAHQADNAAEKHQVGAMGAAASKLKNLIAGGEHAEAPVSAPPTPPKPVAQDKGAPKR